VDVRSKHNTRDTGKFGMRIRVFSPRTQAPILVDVAAGETVAALRGRVAQQLGGSANSVLLLAGQKVLDPVKVKQQRVQHLHPYLAMI